ncbi:Ionotropic glutamate receptor [Trinorchestia longiramus]|nr:Ionotropic glutamate receptor [Trinorchestia longiramus]
MRNPFIELFHLSNNLQMVRDYCNADTKCLRHFSNTLTWILLNNRMQLLVLETTQTSSTLFIFKALITTPASSIKVESRIFLGSKLHVRVHCPRDTHIDQPNRVSGPSYYDKLTQEADVGIGPFAMTYSRSIAIDFTAPILQDYFRILVRSGLPEPDPWGFLKPFTVVTWIGILLSGLTTCCALLIAIQVSRTRLDAQQSIALWVRYFFKLLGVILAQDFKVLAVEAAVYALVGGWMIFCLVMMRSFAGALTSQLSVRYVPTPIRNLEELVRHPSMKVVLETQTTFSDYVRTTKEGPFGELSTFYDKGRVKEVTSLEFPKTMLDEVSSGEYVLLTDELTLLRLLSLEFSKTGICSYYLAEDRFKPWLLSFIGSKNHPLVPAMSDKIMSIVESGLYMRWLMEEIPNATSCNSQASTMSVSEPYDMQGLWGVFVLLTCGLSLAVVVFVYEVMNPKHQNLLLLKSHRIAE